MELKSETFFAKLLLVVGIIANIGGVVALFGIEGSMKTGLILCAIGILLIAGMAIANYQNKYKMLLERLELAEQKSIPIIDHITLIRKELSFKNWKEIHIIGSGTETYYTLIEGLLHDRLINKGLIINVVYRVGHGEKRAKKLEAYDDKWANLATEYKLDLKFFPVEDFNFFFRGLLLDKSYGCIGFYHRINAKTSGVSENCLVVSDDKELGKYLIDNFLRCFDFLNEKDTMISTNE